jgi:hypothetical protein
LLKVEDLDITRDLDQDQEQEIEVDLVTEKKDKILEQLVTLVSILFKASMIQEDGKRNKVKLILIMIPIIL